MSTSESEDSTDGPQKVPKQRLLASSIGGMVTSLIMTPLDVVKTRMQVIFDIQSIYLI